MNKKKSAIETRAKNYTYKYASSKGSVLNGLNTKKENMYATHQIFISENHHVRIRRSTAIHRYHVCSVMYTYKQHATHYDVNKVTNHQKKNGCVLLVLVP